MLAHFAVLLKRQLSDLGKSVGWLWKSSWEYSINNMDIAASTTAYPTNGFTLI